MLILHKADQEPLSHAQASDMGRTTENGRTCRGNSRSCKNCDRSSPMESCTQSLMAEKGNRGSTDTCPEHSDKPIEYYCTNHSDVGCSACMTIDHRSCNVDYIPNVASDISGYDCYRKLDKALRDLGTKYDEVKKTSAKNVQKVENDFRRSLIGIRQLRKNVNTYFDKLESNVVKVLLNLKDTELRKLSTVSKKCVAVTAELNAVTSELEYKRHYGQQDQFFIAMKKSEMTLKKLQMELENTDSETKVNRFKYDRSVDVSDALKSVKTFGDIVSVKDPEEAEAELAGDVSACLGTEGRCCSVTGVLNIDGGPLVIADYNNRSVKLLNKEENKIIWHMTMTSEPWDLTQVADGRIAVTLPNEQKIAFLSLSDSLTSSSQCTSFPVPLGTRGTGNEEHCEESSTPALSKESALTVTGTCKGIAKYGDRLIVSYCNPGKVEILEMNGTLLRRLGDESGREADLMAPDYVALSPDQTTIYVSDKGAGKVVCFSIEGKLRGVYKDRGLTEPGGVVVDQDGTVFVCDTSNSQVHMLTPDGAKIKTILNNTLGLASPKCIAYSVIDHQIFVGTLNKGVVGSFKIS